MSILDYFKPKKSAKTAKDRLQIIIAQERSRANESDFLPVMREEILKVIEKYMGVSLTDVKVDLHKNENNAILELNITLPEKSKAAATC